MLYALISPAKKLDFAPAPEGVKATAPALLPKAQALIKRVKKYTAGDLKRLMDLSPKLAELNYQRFQAFTPQNDEGTKAAIYAFAGDVYMGFDAKTLSAADIKYAQDHIGILSGLYGLLRPLDAIQPYRLEMGTSVDTDAGEDLYDYWRESVTAHLNAITAKLKNATVVNLASDEYWSAVNKKGLKAPIVQCAFKEVKAGQAKVISFMAKKARGMMARYIAEQRVESVDGLKAFTSGGYAYDAKASTGDILVFTRKAK
ncbi:MAG: peroxide stress protein YaaA [Rhodospirillaceae bacterium]|nr:peroxide stress protein YaaA [Rhodospirillaceae bacterium]